MDKPSDICRENGIGGRTQKSNLQLCQFKSRQVNSVWIFACNRDMNGSQPNQKTLGHEIWWKVGPLGQE